MRYLVSSMLVAVGIIHLLPAFGMLGNHQLSALYDLSFSEPNLEILMRHRAVLFGLLGVFLVFAAFRPTLQGIALVAGLVSIASFLWLTHSVGEYNAHLSRVVAIDIAALIMLTIGSIAYGYIQLFSWAPATPTLLHSLQS